MSRPQVRTSSRERQTLRLDKNSSFNQIPFAKGRPVNSKGSKRYRASKSIPFAYRSSLRNRNDSSILFWMISQFSPNATHGYSHSDKIFEAYRARSIQARNLKYVDRPGQISQVTVREPSLRKSPFLCPFNCKYRVSIAEGIGCGSIAEFFQLSHGKLRNKCLKGLKASVLNWQLYANSMTSHQAWVAIRDQPIGRV